MRIIFFLILFLFSTILYPQISSYNDLGILFSRDNNEGTARFKGLSGAFGALGGDISSTNINPAGAAVAKTSNLYVTLNNQNFNHESNFYGNSIKTQNNNLNISQVGGLLAFDSAYNSKWNRFALFFNYTVKNDFSNSYTAEGSSSPLYKEHFSDPNTNGQFDRNLFQNLSYEASGRRRVFDVGFSSTYQNKLFVGAALKLHDINFFESSFFIEDNDDIDGNILTIEDYSESFIQSTGISFNLGFIYKLNKNIRFGLAYESPAWHQEAKEDYFNELYMAAIQDLQVESHLNAQSEFLQFRFQSASKFTLSSAYIFGKKGLISIDYTHRNYRNIQFESFNFADINGNFINNFSQENNNFNSNYRNTYSLKIGTEWRINKISLRGGVSYEKDPNLIIGSGSNEDNIKSFSLGLGYNFGNSKFDLSYTNTENTDFYTISNPNDLNIENTISQISGTFTINL